MLGCCREAGSASLVYEWMDGGDLQNVLESASKKAALPLKERTKILYDVAQALEHCHHGAQKVRHRDIKPANIMLTASRAAKLGDFGVAKVQTTSRTATSENVKGTYAYLCPNYLHTRVCTTESDVYSFGVVIIQMFTGEDTPKEAMKAKSNILDGLPLSNVTDHFMPKEDAPEEILEELAALALACIALKDVKQRPKMGGDVDYDKTVVGRLGALL